MQQKINKTKEAGRTHATRTHHGRRSITQLCHPSSDNVLEYFQYTFLHAVLCGIIGNGGRRCQWFKQKHDTQTARTHCSSSTNNARCLVKYSQCLCCYSMALEWTLMWPKQKWSANNTDISAGHHMTGQRRGVGTRNKEQQKASRMKQNKADTSYNCTAMQQQHSQTP